MSLNTCAIPTAFEKSIVKCVFDAVKSECNVEGKLFWISSVLIGAVY